MKVTNLKLLATSSKDLKVIAAHLQDAIVSTIDIASLKKNRIFLIQLNRFMWEDVEKGMFRKNKRIRTVLKFDNVISVLSKNINTQNLKNFLDFSIIRSLCATNKIFLGFNSATSSADKIVLPIPVAITTSPLF